MLTHLGIQAGAVLGWTGQGRLREKAGWVNADTHKARAVMATAVSPNMCFQVMFRGKKHQRQ